MNTVNVMINDFCYQKKPTGEAVKAIQSNFRPCEMTMEELITALTNGKTIRPAIMTGRTKDSFQSAEIIAIDIDNKTDDKLTVDKAVQIAKQNGLNVWFCYFSFSHTADCPKFRVVFRLSEPITDLNQYEAIKKQYASVFGQAADQACSNADRLYFGTQNKVIPYRDDSAINAVGNAPAAVKTKKNRKHKVTQSKAVDKFNTLHMQAIRDNDPERLHELLGSPAKRWFENNDDFYSFLRSVNLIDFLGLPVSLDEKFRCLEPGHADLHPSARIFMTDKGNYLYHCDSCGNRNIKQLVEMLAGFTAPGYTVEFLKKSLNLEVVETASSRIQMDNLTAWDRAINLNRPDNFAEICPVADKILRERGKIVLSKVLSHAAQTINPHLEYTDGVIFTMPLSMLSASPKEQKEIVKNLKTLIALHVIETVPITKVPKRLLSSIARRPKDSDKPNSDPTVYRIPGWVLAQQKIINDSAATWRSKKMSKSQMSFDYVTAVLGDAEAKRIYPSYAEYSSSKNGEVTTEKRKVNSHNAKLDDTIAAVLANQINDVGYCTMQKVVDLSGLSTKQVRNRIGIVTADMGLKSVFLTDALKSKYNATEPGRPKVYVLD